MEASKIRKLLELVYELVKEPGATWREKRERVLEEASEQEETQLFEFAAWFE